MLEYTFSLTGMFSYKDRICFCPYMGIYSSEKTRILAYFKQWKSRILKRHSSPCLTHDKYALFIFRSSLSQMFYKIGVLKILQNSQEKQPFRIHFSIKFQVFRPASVLKRDSSTAKQLRMAASAF